MPTIRLFWDYMNEQLDRIRRVVDVLDSLKLEYAMTGGPAVSYHWRPRMTVDVDFLVPSRSLRKIEAALPPSGFIVERRGEILRAWDAGANPDVDESVVDLVPADFNETQREAVRTALDVDYMGIALRVVNRPALVALKFLSAASPTRQLGDKHQDITDIIQIVRQKWSPKLTSEARSLVERSYATAGADLEKLVDDILVGRPITI